MTYFPTQLQTIKVQTVAAKLLLIFADETCFPTYWFMTCLLYLLNSFEF